jgi:hypothetical protein
MSEATRAGMTPVPTSICESMARSRLEGFKNLPGVTLPNDGREFGLFGFVAHMSNDTRSSSRKEEQRVDLTA